MNTPKIFILLLVVFCFDISLQAQDVVKVVTLEGVDISAVADDFDTKAFIEKVKNDNTFYLAFKALNYYPARYNAWLKVFKRGEKEKGHVNRSAERFKSEDLMWVVITEEEIKGKVKKKNGKYKYLTAEVWDEVFFPVEKKKVNMKPTREFEKNKDLSSSEKHRMEVKQMMFNPGLEVDGIPFIGKKMGIFEELMHEYYEYSVYQTNYKDSIECLVFEAEIMEGFREGKTVIKSLLTYFDKETYEVLKRDIHLKYFSLPIDFDIYINVENQRVNGVLLPEKIYYKGFFDLPFMKKEEIEFMLYDFDYLF